MKPKLIKWTALVGLLCLSVIAIAFSIMPGLAAQANYSGYPTISIITIVSDQKVTIQTQNLPANDRFEVHMGAYGSLGWGNYVTTVDSAGGGTQKYEVSIPSALKGSDRIAIRIDSPTTGYYAYDWFWNNASLGVTTTPQPTKATSTPAATGTPKPTASGLSGYPYFYIASVTRNGKVSITAYNFPANDSFEVKMNLYGTLGIGGYKTDTVTTDANGKLSSVTFTIPSQLADQDRIAIRLEGAHSGYYAFNWFWNYNFQP